MQTPKGGKSHQVLVWLLHATSLKSYGSHLTCKVVNKCLNVHERVAVARINKDGRLLLSREVPVSLKENSDRKKKEVITFN